MNDRTTAKGPNKYPDARSEEEREALRSTCRFLGKIFYEGDRICYREREWECAGGEWVETGSDC